MRLLTRSDFDGLICAVLLKEAGIMDEWKFVHPKDVQDGIVNAGEDDILANVPYVSGVGLWFDHHSSEQERLDLEFAYKGLSKDAPSCARVIWEYYGGHKTFAERFDEMMEYVDKCDSAQFTADEIENPKGWILLSFVMDPRTGLGRYRDYRISNYQLMMRLVDWLREKSIDEILVLPDVKERLDRYFAQDKLFQEMLWQNSKAHGDAVVVDLRKQEEIYTGNRFVIYSMYPDCNISVQIIWGKDRQNTVMTVGHSILNRTSKVDVGNLMLKYGGGGHRQVGTCQVDNKRADVILKEILGEINSK